MTPDSEWHNVGGGYYPDIFYDGSIRLYDRVTFDVNAQYFPIGKLNLRYRLRNEPGIENSYYPDSEWTIISRFKVAFDNLEGYVDPDFLYIYVNLPSAVGSSCSVYVDNQSVQPKFGTNCFVCKRTKDNGKYIVTASKYFYSTTNGGGQYRQARKEGTYDERVQNIIVSFSDSDFNN